MKRRLSVTNFSLENNLPTFRLNAPLGRKWRSMKQTPLFIAWTTEDTHHWRSKVDEHCSSLPASSSQWSRNQDFQSSILVWRSKVDEHCSSLPASSSQWSSNQGLPVLHLGWSAPLRVSSEYARPPSPTAPVLFHGPALWSPPSGWGGSSPMHAPLQPTSSSLPSCRHLDVPSRL